METIGTRIAWEGKWRVRVDSVRLPGGEVLERGLIEHPGAVVLLPLLPRAAGGYDVLILRQYRPALRRTILELPAGTREPDEPWLACAQRELQEETGHRAATFTPLGEIWPAPGISDERMALFMATGLAADPLPMDIDEEIVVETWALADLVEMALDGRLEDGKSVVAVLRAARHLGDPGLAGAG
jgi:ADP-ribose pyrophosphatase